MATAPSDDESPGQPAAELRYATLAERFGGVIVDTLALVIPFFGVALLPESLGGIYILLWFAYFVFYTFILEGIWSNQTAGKYLLKMRVAREDGSPARIRDSIIRNLVGIFGQAFGWVGLLVGAFAIWQSDTNKRLGDSVAGTVVIKTEGGGRG